MMDSSKPITAKTIDELFKGPSSEALHKMGEAGADFIREQLAKPSVLSEYGIFTPLPRPPYDLAFDGEQTHYAGFVLENTRYVRACDGENIERAGDPASAPTCLSCARLA